MTPRRNDPRFGPDDPSTPPEPDREAAGDPGRAGADPGDDEDDPQRADRLARDRRHFGFLEDDRRQFGRCGRRPAADVAPEEAFDVRVDVEGALGLGDGHALDLPQHPDHRAAAPVEGLAHLLDDALVSGQRGDRRPLGDVGDVGGGVRLHVRGGLHGVGRAVHPAHAPAGHGVGLGHAVERDRLVRQFRHLGQKVGHRRSVVDEVLVDLVGDHPQAVRRRPLADGADLLGGVHGSRRVRRRA